MDRLTFRAHDGGIFVKESDVKTFDVEDEIMHTGNAIRKLSHYEDLEAQLQEVYGECEGLLEESIKCLVEHEEVDIGKPSKARLLTDGSVDKWLRWKELEAEGRLLELPCKVGDTVYMISSEKWCELEDDYVNGDLTCIVNRCDRKCKEKYVIEKIPATLSCIANIVRHKENPSEDFRVYLTKEEAREVLKEIRDDGK